MAPFYEPSLVIQGFKERVESLTVHSDRLFIGTGTGNLHIYNIDQDERKKQVANLVSTKSLGRRAIEQVGFVKDINSVVALSDGFLTLYPLPELVPPTPLPQTRKAFSFAVSSTVENVSPEGKVQSFDDAAPGQTKGVPTVVTYLVVGGQRKLLVYSWRDGEAQEVKEAPLPHSARVITFLKPTVLCLAYQATEHVLFFLETMSTAELTMPLNIPTSTSTGAYGMNALTGLGGYMTLGLAAKAKPLAVAVGEDLLIPKDNAATFFGADGKAKQNSLLWNAPPEDIVYVKPYILSIQPAGTVSTSSLSEPSGVPTGPNGLVQPPVVQIQSSISLQHVQSLVLPASACGSTLTASNHIIRLPTPSPVAKSPVFVVSTPSERNAAAADGSSVWVLRMRQWGDQVDELVDTERYSDALELLETIDQATLPDKEVRRAKIRALDAVAQFKEGKFDKAVNTFIELDVNPGKVVALFPESVSGRLHVPSERWIPLFGGRERERKDSDLVDTVSPASDDLSKTPPSRSMGRSPSPAPSVRTKLRSAVDAVKQGVSDDAASLSSVRAKWRGAVETIKPAVKDDDTASIRARGKGKSVDPFVRSVETLMFYLTDRRPKVTGALAAVHITPSQSHQFPSLSATSVDDLLALPSAPLSVLTPEQLTRFAQIVDTALFKSYLIIRPGLVGPLCSLDNWCEVEEVEEMLQEREKFSELIQLYNGRKMHGKALSLLRRLSDKESDTEDKITPTVSYVQKLGPEYLEQIFGAARWVFQQDANAAFEIFTAEITELPRSKVADFLEELDPGACARYLEYLISERDEVSTLFHDRLAELYLEMSIAAAKRGDKDEHEMAYAKFLDFIQTSDIYRVDRLFGLLPSDDMFEARAILLGRLGRHESALETYVYRLGDYIKAEEYCKSIYLANSPTQEIFLSLLKIYLEPTQKQQATLLKPALDLISRQSPRLNTLETLRLLPPLVTAQEVKAFLDDATRAPIFDTRVVREVRKGRSEQVARKLMVLQSNRVKVTDSRICPQCHKRLGNSVIAVHAPRGEVTHYQCREAFSKKRKEQHAH